MVFRRIFEFLLLIMLTAPAVAQNGLDIYCCDANGQTNCGDRLPSACYSRAYRVISPDGRIKRTVAAPLSQEEQLKAEAEKRKREEEQARVLRQKRLDQALLETYRDATEIDLRRDRLLADIDRALEVLNAREKELIDHRRGIEKQIADYTNGDVPSYLKEQLANASTDVNRNRLMIDSRLQDRAKLLENFEIDRRRFIELGGPVNRDKL